MPTPRKKPIKKDIDTEPEKPEEKQEPDFDLHFSFELKIKTPSEEKVIRGNHLVSDFWAVRNELNSREFLCTLVEQSCVYPVLNFANEELTRLKKETLAQQNTNIQANVPYIDDFTSEFLENPDDE